MLSIHNADRNSKIPRKVVFFSLVFMFLLKLFLGFTFCKLTLINHPELRIGNLSYSSGDHYSYFGAMENFVSKGSYYFLNYQGDTVRAGRSPHFAIPYYLARQVLSENDSLDFSALLNISIDSIAIICMSLLAFLLAKRRIFVYFLGILFGALSTYISNWSFNTVPDGPAASLFMIGVFYYWKVYSNENISYNSLLLSSLFFSWAIVLRPFLIVVIAFIAIPYLYRIVKKENLKVMAKIFIVAAFPLVAFLSPWMIRNYNLTAKFIPFQQDIYAGYNYHPSELAMRNLMTSMGEDGSTYWDPKSMASYFYPTTYTTSLYRYPTYLLRDTSYIRRLEDLRLELISGFSKRDSSSEKLLATKITGLALEYKRNFSVRIWSLNVLKRVVKFWSHSGSYYLPSYDKSAI